MTAYSWICESWYRHGSTLWVDPLLALVAVWCGLIVGGERQRREKPAGMRTMALVCLGSAIFTMLSFAFTSTTGDSGRVAAQIVTGIGFLGAGVILHGKRIVSGVTTAAIIWVAAAIGMAVGAGYIMAGLALSILVNRLLVGIFLYETRWHPELHDVRVQLEYFPKGGLTRIRLERILIDYESSGVTAEWVDPSAEIGCLTLKMKLARVHLFELLDELAEVPEVRSIHRERYEPVKATAKS
jgi:putative Mg2+ transporter-C (MgtC) family protein